MLRDDWKELVAQVEDHGPELVQFYLQLNDETNETLDIEILNIAFENDEVKVVLA